MKGSVRRAALSLFLFFAGSFVEPSGANAQDLDHLECYNIRDTLGETRYTADLENQFGVQPGCLIGTPARLFCVETEKRVVGSPQPPGGGPSGADAGHFLCYTVRCPGEAAITTVAQDQFGTRRIVLERETLLCAPANKLICGDGEIDPGEACDTGSAATSTCPDGSACRPDCTCPTSVCCQCPDRCIDLATGQCPTDCTPIVATRCTPATGRCEPPCPCDASCMTDDGEAGTCRLTGTSPVSPCECMPPPDECPCGTTCVDATGNAGRCRPDPLTGACTCFVPPPNDCPCGSICTNDAGQVGRCVANNSTNGDCQCRVVSDCLCGARCTNADGTVGVCVPNAGSNVCTCEPPPPDDCPCGATCLDENGEGGHCRPLNGLPCRCLKDEEPPECPCGATCTDATTNVVGHCRRVPGGPANECRCTPEQPDCPCGSECKQGDLAGQCRPLLGPNAPCSCFIPPGNDCPCGTACRNGNGVAGHCRPVAGDPTNACRCREDEPPPECPCGTECKRRGQVGECRPLNGMDAPCDCVIPPVEDCPCDAVCTDSAGIAGHCRKVPGGPANACRCAADPPPNDCPCGSVCATENGVAGRCRPTVAGAPCSCAAVEENNSSMRQGAGRMDARSLR